jgi:hypothetical protein
MIPCDPVDYLNQIYGYFNWLTPISTAFTWPNMVFSGYWNDFELSRAFKAFYLNGTLNEKRTLDTINQHLHFKLTQLPNHSYE